MDREAMYVDTLVAAFVRGKLVADNQPGSAHDWLWRCPLNALSSDDVDQLVRLGKEAGLRLHKFKRTMELPRVRRVLGVLKGLSPTDLLDVGSGRGTFLWPLLDSFPRLPVLAIDRDVQRVADIAAVRDGGIATLDARQMDATALALDDGAFDVVTMLEVLEHIPAAQRALAEAMRVARRFVVVSVPSTPDNNPEHIHLFTGQELTALFERAAGGTGKRGVRAQPHDRGRQGEGRMSEALYKYPRTYHIEGSRLQPGDQDLACIPFAEIAGRRLVVEEKVGDHSPR